MHAKSWGMKPYYVHYPHLSSAIHLRLWCLILLLIAPVYLSTLAHAVRNWNDEGDFDVDSPVSDSAADPTFNLEILEALLIESLRDNLAQACDGERAILHCPRNTHIVVGHVFYGRLVPSEELCPRRDLGPGREQPGTNRSSISAAISAGSGAYDEDTSCAFPKAQAKIVSYCRNTRNCRIHVTPEFFFDSSTSSDHHYHEERDPCPTTNKYLQVSYKCKPVSFEDGDFCEGTRMPVRCRPNMRMVIHSAQYGRTINGRAVHCSLQEAEGQDCVGDVLPLIVRKCHAQTECSLDVNDHTLGNPCQRVDEENGARGALKYLSLVYICVNSEVFNEAAIKGRLDTMRDLDEELLRIRELQQLRPTPAKSSPSHDTAIEYRPEVMAPVYRHLYEKEDRLVGGEGGRGEDRPPKISESIGYPRPSDSEPTSKSVENLNDLIHFVLDNKEKSTLYFFLSTSVIVILLLIGCIYYQCRARRVEKKRLICNRQTICLPSSTSSPPLMKQSSLGYGGSSQNTSPFSATYAEDYEYCGAFFHDNFRQNEQQAFVKHSGGGLHNGGLTTGSGWSSGSGGGGETSSGSTSHYVRLAQSIPYQRHDYNHHQQPQTPKQQKSFSHQECRQITPVRPPLSSLHNWSNKR